MLGNVDYVPPEDDRDWLKKANQSTSLVAHIESVAGFENAEEIVSTPNLDAVYVGPYDSSIAMGAPGQYNHPRLKKAMHHVLTCCLEHKVAFGTTTSGPRSAAQWIKSGCRFFEVVDELSLINQGASRVVDQYKQLS